MAIITPDKNKLYIYSEYPVSSGCLNRLKALAEKLNQNFQAEQLILRGNYNPQIKKLLEHSINDCKNKQIDKHHPDTSKHVLKNPIRFKRRK